MPIDWTEWELAHGYIRVSLRLLPTEDGGRSRPVYSDYRSTWDIGNAHQGERAFNDAPLRFEQVDKLEPGQEAVARSHPGAPKFWGHVQRGSRIYAHEGSRRIGEATVLSRTEELTF